MGNIATKKDQLWSADGLGLPAGYYFVAKSGGETSMEASKIRDGGKTEKEIIVTDADTSNIVLRMLYRPADHATVLNKLDDRIKKGERVLATLKKVDCDADKSPIGDVRTYANCLLMAVRVPDHDSNDAAEAIAELEFMVP